MGAALSILAMATGLTLLVLLFRHLDRQHHETFACCQRGRESWIRCDICQGGLCRYHAHGHPDGGRVVCDRCMPRP